LDNLIVGLKEVLKYYIFLWVIMEYFRSYQLLIPPDLEARIQLADKRKTEIDEYQPLDEKLRATIQQKI
jgi:hypothetical protein